MVSLFLTAEVDPMGYCSTSSESCPLHLGACGKLVWSILKCFNLVSFKASKFGVRYLIEWVSTNSVPVINASLNDYFTQANSFKKSTSTSKVLNHLLNHMTAMEILATSMIPFLVSAWRSSYGQMFFSVSTNCLNLCLFCDLCQWFLNTLWIYLKFCAFYNGLLLSQGDITFSTIRCSRDFTSHFWGIVCGTFLCTA